MSAEIYKCWVPPATSCPMQLAFDALHVDGGQLIVQLHEADSTRRRVSLHFQSLPLLIKMVNESHRLESLKRLPQPREGSMYIVKNSELIKVFHKDALGIYASDPLFHFAVVTDEWIDLIVAEFPVVKY